MFEPVQKVDNYNLCENAVTHLITSNNSVWTKKNSLFKNGKPLTLGTSLYLNNLIMYADT